MQIAILTQPLRSNYGGILQAFALQQTLINLGHQVTTVNRQPDQGSRIRITFRTLKNLTRQLISLNKLKKFNEAENKIIFKNTTEFIENNISLSPLISSTKELKNYFSENSYEAVIVGSDQTWRPKYSPNILNYYLDFLEDEKIKRIAYASSFGVDEWEYTPEQTLKCKELIKNFNGISVREASGVELCNAHLNAYASIMPDPTLLLDKNDYIKKLNINTDKNTEGVFVYILDPNTEKQKIITEITSTLNQKEFRCQPNKIPELLNSRNLSDYIYPKVEDWVKSFLEAEFIVTDSFHGCVFSLIFNKKFLVIGNKKRGAARFTSLLNNFDLKNRMIENIEELPKDIIRSEINWDQVNHIIKNNQTQAIKFLRDNLTY